MSYKKRSFEVFDHHESIWLPNKEREIYILAYIAFTMQWDYKKLILSLYGYRSAKE